MGKSLEERIRLIEDREEIARLKHTYCSINNGGWRGVETHHDIDKLIDIFVPDGVWDGSPELPKAVGHQQIRDLFTMWRALPFVIHFVTNPVIDVDGDTAHAVYQAIITPAMPCPDGSKQAMWIFGQYEEDYVRTPQGWKYKVLRFVSFTITTFEEGWAKLQFAPMA